MQKKDIGYLIKNINDKMKVNADADLKRYNLTLTQSRVMSYLGSCGGQTTQKDIEVYLEVSHPTVVGVVSRMEQNGYVTSWQSEDRRNKNVKLTPKAEAIDEDLRKNMRANEQKLLKPLSEQEREQLCEMLTMLLKNLE